MMDQYFLCLLKITMLHGHHPGLHALISIVLFNVFDTHVHCRPAPYRSGVTKYLIIGRIYNIWMLLRHLLL